MIIWGYKGYQREIGQTQTAIQCGHCGNLAPWEIHENGRKFTLYWIPLFPYGRSYFISCSVCHYGKEISSSEINEFLNY